MPLIVEYQALTHIPTQLKDLELKPNIFMLTQSHLLEKFWCRLVPTNSSWSSLHQLTCL